MNVTQALAAAAARGLDRLDAQLLLLHALGRSQNDRAWLLAHDGDELASDALRSHLVLCDRRRDGEPLAYIVGRKEFHGLMFNVDARVLVPRPDTETLVDWALEILDGFDNPHPAVIDLGTGSGAIALSIKHRCRGAVVEAVDSSSGALAVASANARELRLDVNLRLGSWLDGTPGRYDLILSNPPYVAQADPHLAALQYEPLSALAAGPDGLVDLRDIVRQGPSHLVSGGWLLLEHGHDQAAPVRAFLAAAGFGFVASRRDLAGTERCTGGKWLELG